MAIDELIAIVPPPAAPVEAGTLERRREIEQSLGIILPDDFFELGMHYGSGSFGGEIEILNPFSNGFRDNVEFVAAIYRDLKRDEGDEFIPYDIYPTPKGFLPWGTSTNGHVFFWKTDGEPNHWPIALVVGREADVYEILQMSMTTFLAKLFKATVPCVLWDIDWQQRNLVGKPFRPA